MEKQEAKSKWDELVRQLGADVTPEAEQLVETGPAPPMEPVSYPSATSSAAEVEQIPPAPKRPAAGWDNLANEFGLPVIEEPLVREVEEVVVAKKEVIVSRVADAERPRRERPGQDRGERYEKRREPEKSREPSPRHREGPPRRREAPERGRKSPDFRDQRQSAEQVADPLPPERSAPPVARQEREERKAQPVDEPPKPGPAVSLWHKIFGSPADQSAKLEEISTRPEEEEAPSESSLEQSNTYDAKIDRHREADADEVFEAEERSEFQRGLDAELESEQPEQDEKRPRRPRRRRRGRGGRGDAESDARRGAGQRQHQADDVQQEEDDYDDPAVDQDEDEFDLSQEDDADGADDIEGAETSASRTARGRASLARNIPTWDEAIGFIVDVNMQSRSQRRQSGHASSRGNSRGRPRGRRKN